MSPRGASAGGWAFVAATAVTAMLVTACTTQSTTGPDRTPSAEDRTPPSPADRQTRARVRLQLASAYFGRGQNDTALDEVRQALAVEPEMGEAYNLRGLIQAAMGDVAAADGSFRRALQLNARDGDAMQNYGWFLCQQRRFDDAETQFAGALALPGYRDAVRTLLAQGVCYARAGRLRDAERTLMRSYELDPANPAAAVNLSEVLYRSGEYERARFYIRRVNVQPAWSNAQTLWLAARIENRLGNRSGTDEFGRQLRNRFPQSPETLAYDQGRFDE